MHPVVSRRAALGLGLGSLAGAALAGCGSSDSTAPPGSGWTYVDARGKRITVDHLPRRIVAHSGVIGALADYGVPFIGVYGPHAPVGGSPNPQSGDAKFAGVASLGERYRDFSVDRLLALKPDLVLEGSFVPGKPAYLPEPVLDRIEQEVPVAVLDTDQNNTVPALLDRFTVLAQSLGGVVDMAQQRAARAGFDQATAMIKTGLAANTNLRVLNVSVTSGQFAVVRPDAMTGLRYLTGLGMHIVNPPHVGPDDYATPVGADQLGAYPADVVLYDSRVQAPTLAALKQLPAFRDLPAVRADQTAPWNPEVPPSYQQWARALIPVAAWVGNFRSGIG